MTYGRAPYGLSPWGGGAAIVSIARAWATSTRTIHVETSAPAMATDSFDPGDALNPDTWFVNRMDTMAAFTVSGIVVVNGLTSFEVTVMENLGDHTVSHRIGSATLRGASTALVTAPYQALFPGVVYSADLVEAALRQPFIRDLANPFRFNPSSGDTIGAILTSGGTYVGEVNAAVTRKCIIRRVTTTRGAIRHLPNYGVSWGIKQEFPSGASRDALRVDIEKQVKQEPGVKRVRVTISQLAAGAFRIAINVTVTGAQYTIAMNRDRDGQFHPI